MDPVTNQPSKGQELALSSVQDDLDLPQLEAIRNLSEIQIKQRWPGCLESKHLI